MKNLLNIKAPHTEPLRDKRLKSLKIVLNVARLDAVHPFISGNKYYKLTLFLNAAIKFNASRVISFGGAYSNHLHALACVAKKLGIKSEAMIRGEEPKKLSPTLTDCKENGMTLRFLSREEYRIQNNLALQHKLKIQDAIIIPEGGFGVEGMMGAEQIYDDLNGSRYSHIIGACGTGTTLAGILNKANNNQEITGVSVLKGHHNLKEDILALSKNSELKKLNLLQDYHFGGYAKYGEQLITFMNNWYSRFHIPSDFVYTGKLFFALDDLLEKGYFPAGSEILCIHSGGLQGNRSLKPGTLIF